jgi:hypothetical protein
MNIIHTYIHTHIYTYIHTHTHTYIHTQVRICKELGMKDKVNDYQAKLSRAEKNQAQTTVRATQQTMHRNEDSMSEGENMNTNIHIHM